MNPRLVLWLLIAIGAIWTAAWAFVLLRSRPGQAFEEIEPAENRIRLWLLFVLTLVLFAAFALTVSAYPYARFRSRALGAPIDSVRVMGMQWGWSVTPHTVRVGVPVLFAVQSNDVNHGFGVYDPDGTLITQVQAMPGYTNRLIYQFDRPGTYTVRCLEYCGIFHHMMRTTFVVR